MHLQCPVPLLSALILESIMSPLNPDKQLILGVDTHLDIHVAVLINSIGQTVSDAEFPTTPNGYQKLLRWCRSFGILQKAGVEGTGTYGAGLYRFFDKQQIPVFEVNRPNRLKRRLQGKSDTTDAENAARAILAGEAKAIPKKQNGTVEALRFLIVTRRGAVKGKTQAINQIRALLVTAPDEIRKQYLQVSPQACIKACRGIISLGETPLLEALALSLILLANRWQSFTTELKQIDKRIKVLTKRAAPSLLEQYGVGPYVAATLLVTAGDNPERLKSEASFAALCGVSPKEASSGKTIRHRLNRGGSREANNALWTVSLIRMRSDPRTQKYVERRTIEGRSTKEIQRCLKRYIAREVFPVILRDLKCCTRY